jgi:uncharacterized membrane protein YhaH (DUF805 family)
MEWMILPLKRYADFQGRSRRMEYWMFFLFTILVNIGFVVLMMFVGGGAAVLSGGAADGNPAALLAAGGAIGIIYLISLIFSLAILIPSIAVGVRRLHDTDRTGWWLIVPVLPYLAGLTVIVAGAATLGSGGGDTGAGVLALVGGLMVVVGFICALALIVFFFLPGTTGPNRFGPDPKNPEANLESVFS